MSGEPKWTVGRDGLAWGGGADEMILEDLFFADWLPHAKAKDAYDALAAVS